MHVRAKQSSNRDLKMLSRLTGENKFHRVTLAGTGMESVITNSAYLAGVLEEAKCTSRDKVEATLEEEIKGPDWER